MTSTGASIGEETVNIFRGGQALLGRKQREGWHATAMPWATIFPDWNSLDSVRRAHSRLEFAALAFFALLVAFDVLAHMYEETKGKATMFERIGLWCFAIAVLCEIGAYPYGQRNDNLSEQTIRSLDKLAHDAAAVANEAKATAGQANITSGAANDAAGQAREKADASGKIAARAIAGEDALEHENASLKTKIAPRRVSGDQATKLCAFIHVATARSMDIMSSAGMAEPDDFAEDIGRAIVNCQRGLSVHLAKSVLISPLPRPFRIAYAPSRKDDAQMLSDAMVNTHIAAKAIEMIPAPDADQHPDALRLFVGPKLPEP